MMTQKERKGAICEFCQGFIAYCNWGGEDRVTHFSFFGSMFYYMSVPGGDIGIVLHVAFGQGQESFIKQLPT